MGFDKLKMLLFFVKSLDVSTFHADLKHFGITLGKKCKNFHCTERLLHLSLFLQIYGVHVHIQLAI